MPYISARNLSLTFPLYRRIEGGSEPDPLDARVIRDGRRILGIRALNDVSLELPAASRLAVIGSNGSGKTTLLRVLAGLLSPDTGEVRTQGHATNLINNSFGLRTEASGHRNITLRGLALGYTRERIEAARDDIASFSELKEFLHMPISAYSSGMRMRLSFAIATAFEPTILILDEWLSTGDHKFREKAAERMQRFVEKAGVMVLASHSRRLLFENCNRAVWLHHGEIAADGNVDAVFSEYEKSGSYQAERA